MLYPENIREVNTLKPDFIGYIFFPASKRYVGDQPDPAIFRIPDRGIEKVGVFVNEDFSEVKRCFEKYHLDMIQLHGTESPQYCRELNSAGIPVIKVLNPMSLHDGKNLHEYGEIVKYFLIDTPGEGFGGTGQKFDWALLNSLSFPVPFLLSGGIGPQDYAPVRQIDHADLFGIDVNSKFELAPGRKDFGLLKDFVQEMRT